MMQDLTTTIKAIRAHPHYKGTRNLFILFLYLLVGCLAYGELEGWHFGRSLSFTVVTITTVGYGYHTPSNDASRLFTIFYIIFGIIYVFAIVSEFVQGQLSKFSDILQKRLVSTEEIGADYQNNRRLVVYNVVAIILTILLGGVVLMTLEDWTFIQGVYFALETSTTIGYGDLDIRDGYTHLFMGFYIIFSTALFAFALNNVATLREKGKQMHKLEKMMIKRKNMQFLEDLDRGDGLTKDTFIIALLLHFGTLDEARDVKPWADKFEALDRLHKGRIYREDLHNFTATEAQVAAEEIEKLEKDSKLMSRATLEAFRPSELGMSFSAPTNRVSNPMFIERASLQLQTPLMPPGPLPEHITDSAI